MTKIIRDELESRPGGYFDFENQFSLVTNSYQF